MTASNIEPSLQSRLWALPAGSDVTVSPDTFSVCLSETSKSSTVFAILDVSQGGSAGTYYAKGACPALANGAVPAAPVFSASW